MIVRIFDYLFVDRMFRNNSRNQTSFYPFGPFGNAYRAPAERLADLRQAMRRLAVIALVLAFSLASFLRVLEIPENSDLLGWLIFASSFALLSGVIFYFQSQLARGLEPE